MIYEEKELKQGEYKLLRAQLMSDDEIKRVDYYLSRYQDGKEQLADRLTEWEEIHRAYKGERTDTAEDATQQNPVAVNVILSQVEGQVSSLMNNNITGSYRGVGFSDQKFAKTAGIVGDFILNQNNAKGLTKDMARRYLQFGNAILSVLWDKDSIDKFGMPKIETPKLGTVIIDDKIDDISKDLQRADYIIHEVGSRSIQWAKDKFGDELADAITIGNNDPDFEYGDIDNDESFTYLRVWTKNNDRRNLQLLEMSLCGILLSESDASKPYYTNVFNRYPFFIAGLYKDEGDAYYFGDGKVLLPMQKIINKLYDEIILAVKFASQGRTYADPTSRLNPAEFAAADPSIPIYVNNPSQTIMTERGSGINEVVFHLLQHILEKVQEATRFSALMTGNDPSKGMTATQAGIQMQQGVTGIDDKKSDLSKALGDALNYCIGLCMQFWSVAKAFRVADNDEEFEWIDVRTFKSIPEMIPASQDFIAKWSGTNPKAKEKPKYMQLETEDGKPATKQIELDISVNIGEGLPNNKIALYNMVLSLAQIVLIDEETGQPRPLIGFKQFRSMVEQYLGIRVGDTDEEWQAMVQQQQQMMAQQQQQAKPINVNPNIPGANQNGQMKPGGGMIG